MENARKQRGTKEQEIRKSLLQHIGLGRTAILLLLVFSLINQLLFWMKVDYHFLLSAAVPHYLHWLSRQISATADATLLKVTAAIVTPLSFLAFGACWMLSARRRDVLKTALLLYCADTFLLVVVAVGCIKNPLNCLLEFLVHLIGIAVLYDAYRCGEQLRRMSRKKRPRPAPEQTEHPY